ncbi:MAG: hypothetical protein EOM50_10970 [Erysipelotrichia bacterium]|nr:hypothetical protein [Erysipelotrichia bacterium]
MNNTDIILNGGVNRLIKIDLEKGFFEIYSTSKGGLASSVIIFVSSRHVEAIIMMTYCGDKAKNEV